MFKWCSLAVVFCAGLWMVGEAYYEKTALNAALQKRQEKCAELRASTGKPYEFIEATLVSRVTLMSFSSFTDRLKPLTHDELMKEAAYITAIYENDALSSFLIRFDGKKEILIPYIEILSNEDLPVHSFCAYKIDHPRSRVDYNADITTLEIVR
jgi:hypothetical protein